MNNLAIDTHAHLYMCQKPVAELLENACQNGVGQVVVPGTNLATSKQAGELALAYPSQVFAAAGIHPSEYQDFARFTEFELLLSQYPFQAIGEIGLDYHYPEPQPQQQQTLFLAQLAVAQKHNLPVIIHNREADADMLAILKDFPALTKIFHCYSTDYAFAQNFLDQDAYFSFSGNITYKNKEAILTTIAALPLEKILIETDCPYLSPVPYRGQENEPAYVIEVAKKIAAIKEILPELVIAQTTQTALKIFKRMP